MVVKRTITIPSAVAAAALLAACSGEPSREPPAKSKLETRWSGGPREGAPSDTETGPRLAGPPGSATVPSSPDPAERALEERLFRTDGGRVILRSIRSHGGWARWMAGREARARIPGDPAAPEITIAIGDPPAVPASAEARRLAAPFWMAAPNLRLEYLGVVVDAMTGQTLDMVDVYGQGPGEQWAVAYVDRRTGLVARLVEPPPAASPGAFTRVDFHDPSLVGGLWLPARWDLFVLPDRFARPDLAKPDRTVKIETVLEPRPPENTAGGTAP